ncbi:hypothetical protein [Polyangium mundeleinium]|uniref:HEAT repeat domain-containing protein n=1 Tax=Polyangium mundeleinium TaxID=2995306 RepID=A0ABT5EET0_9BACT|nr:hypothetical protein [Polyangium mundeleinium]MDC0740271.1 hypothetical protein [Polyangium mundeleinium]
MTVIFPHQKIRDEEDRSFTFALLACLAEPDLPEDERHEIADTLERLDDPRAEPRLLEWLQDRAAPPPVREAASSILRSAGAQNRSQLAAMLRDGDSLVQRYAVLGMDHRHADFLEPLARDPGHPLHREAIQAVEWGFEEPRFQVLKIAALSHPDPSLRETAANVLLWDEPVAAEEPLLAALDDTEERVAASAANTLQYYPTRRTLARLAELSAREGKLGEVIRSSFDDLRARFQYDLKEAEGAEREALLAWMQPVWSVLAFTDDEICHEPPESFVRTNPVHDIVTADELLSSLSHADGPWAEKKRRLRSADPAAFSPSDIERLTPFVTTHPDPDVRDEGARLLAAWNRYDELFALLDDPRFHISKTAMYYLGKTTPNALVAERAFRHIFDPRTTTTHAYETLETYVAHTPAEEAILRLAKLAAHDERETLRLHAIYALTRLDAARAIAPLLSLLEAPPLKTWSVHVALLEACRTLGLAPHGLDALRELDNLNVQQAIARIGRPSS